MPERFTGTDESHMRLALRLAARGRGRVEPNPMVGAVIVRHGQILGTGYHQRYGGPHAEVRALQDAARQGHATAGATIYVTLEPCCHFGKTPPCTDALLAAGITRVVAAMVDPFARVHGKGLSLLRRHGVRTQVGVLEDSARQLNAPFITRLQKHRPFVIAKWAQTLDGCIATAGGQSKWISSPHSRQFVQRLRARVDGILVGIGTVLADDPLLIARLDRKQPPERLATRIVLDSQCRLPLESQLGRTLAIAPVLLVHGASLDRAAQRRRDALAAAGVTTVSFPATQSAGLGVGGQSAKHRTGLKPLLKYLADLDFTNLLVEGGGETLAAFLAADLLDEAHIFIAPMLLGGRDSRHAIGGMNPTHLRQAHRWTFAHVAGSGPDLHILAQPIRK